MIKNFSFIATALAILFMSGCSNKADLEAAEVAKQAQMAKEKAEAERKAAEEAARLAAEEEARKAAEEAARLKAEQDEQMQSQPVQNTEIDSAVDNLVQEASAALSELDGAEDIKSDKIRIGKVELTKKKKAALDKLASVLKQHQNVNIEINSYTDAIGKEKRNLQLSKQRANLVKSYLVKQGVEASRITAVGHGESNFVDAKHKKSDKNRRIEIKVIK